MEYTSYPTVNSVLPPQDVTNNKVSAKNFYGSAPLGGSTGITFAGSGGMNGTQGIWLGNAQFSSAPFSVDLQGNVVANTLKITGFVSSGGAAADVNSGATTIAGSKITAGTITAAQMVTGTITAASGIIGSLSASVINTGTLNAALITVNNLTANSITTGTLNGSVVGVTNLNGSAATTFSANTIDGATINLKNLNANFISSGTIDASIITVTNINASNITAGTIGAARISVANLAAISSVLGTVTAGTITGATIKTATTNKRVEITSATNDMRIYDASNTQIAQFAAITGGFLELVSPAVFIGNAAATLSPATQLYVSGSFSATGTKAFDIEHPTKEGMRLKYIAIEADEVLVMCRGIADTEEDIIYPQHFIDVSEEGSVQCQIGKLKGSSHIAWFATAVRKGYADFEPEYTPTP